MNKLKKYIIQISKKNVLFRKFIRKIVYAKRHFIFNLRKIFNKTEENMIIFKAYNGKSYSCSPKAIYEYMLSDEKYEFYKFVWVFKNPDKYKFLKKNKNTIVIKDGGKVYETYMAKAKYWIHNYRVADHIWPKKNQVYVQCWHGTPLKKLGYDLINTSNAMNTTKEIQFKYKVDAKKFKYILSPSKFASEKFISAWNLKALHKETAVIEKGYPRNDFLYNYQKEDIDRIKKGLNIDIGNKKIILYAPTWRDNQHISGIGYTYKTEANFDKLQKELQNEYIILFRAHYLVANSFDFKKYNGFIYDVSNYDDINELYIISDLLITDYSSVFFDYANLKKPIIFYMYDLEQYKDEIRGFYIDLNELPGKITVNEDELIEEINRVTSSFTYDEKYQKFNEKYNYLDDGKASKRIIGGIIDSENDKINH